VNVPDKASAEAAVRSLFQEQLGRDPEEGEMDRYVSMIQSGYRSHPSTTTTTQTTDAQGNTTQKSSTTGGNYDPSSMLVDQAQADPEWGSYQAATKYFNAMISALGAPGGG
jgi:anti-sigma factor ChrR (cupin superfamily)